MTSRDQNEIDAGRLDREGLDSEREPPPPYTPEEIAAKLRRVGDLVGQGVLVTEAVRAVGVSDSTYYRWRAARRRCAQMVDKGGANPDAGPDPDREQRLRRLEVENTRLRRAVAELAIEKQALKEAVFGLA